MRSYPPQPPARLDEILPDDPDKWRYLVFRDGVQVLNYRCANALTGEVELYRRKTVRNTLTGEVSPSAMGYDLTAPDSDRFETLPSEVAGRKVVVEIIRHIPPAGTAAWDAPEPPSVSPVEKTTAVLESAAKGMKTFFDNPERTVLPPLPQPAPAASLALDFGD